MFFKKKDYDFKVIIEGMNCVHCSGKVEKALNELEGVSAKVDLKKKTAFVTADISKKDIVSETVTELGCTVAGVE